MTRLVQALRALGLVAQVSPAGNWVELDGERCRVYVAEASGDRGFYTWCDAPCDRTVEHYRDPISAIRTGLRRAAYRRDTGDLGRARPSS